MSNNFMSLSQLSPQQGFVNSLATGSTGFQSAAPTQAGFINQLAMGNPSSMSFWDFNNTALNFANQDALNMNNQIASQDPTQDFWSLSNPEAWQAGAMGLGAIGGIANAYLGFEQLGMAEDQLAFNKDAFWTNYNMQVEDRELAAQRRAIASGKQ